MLTLLEKNKNNPKLTVNLIKNNSKLHFFRHCKLLENRRISVVTVATVCAEQIDL